MNFESTKDFHAKKVENGNYGLQIKTKKRTWRFFFPTEDERRSWRIAFGTVDCGRGKAMFDNTKGLQLCIRGAHNVPKLDVFGAKSDPYVKVILTMKDKSGDYVGTKI